jgi:hypothetical protein
MSNLTYIHYGITIDGKLYVWHKKRLYKMPNFKQLKQQVFNTSKGYYINRRPYTVNRLKELTEKINIKIETQNDLPF